MTLRIAVAGAGLIGRRHAEAIRLNRDTTVAAIVDPADAGAEVAALHGVRHYRSLADLFAADRPDGMILATPNQLHAAQTLVCLAAAVPTLIEKPLASDLAGAERIVAAGKSSGVPLLCGYHRRHNRLVERAKRAIDDGDIGRIAAVHGSAWFHKPDAYFDVEWRRQKGAGPIYLNLSHDIDTLRYLCGEIASVHAIDSSAIRGNEVEDTAAILLRFASGALGTVTISDTIAAPWSWEMTARENPMYPATSEACYMIGGTHGSLSLPNLALWSHRSERSWTEPISATRLVFEFEDPLVRQVRQFAAVIRGEEPPLVSAEEGLKTQRVIEAVKTSAQTGTTVSLSSNTGENP